MKEIMKMNFEKHFHEEGKHFIRCGGRFEILGNHTDHNHGECIAATCDMAINSVVNPVKDLTINVYSEGYSSIILSLNNLDKQDIEKGSSAALIRGVAKYFKDHGFQIGGFKAYFKSNIFPGAGVSSSAAFELLIAEIFNELYNNSQIDRLTMAKAGQYAEREYYGKSCGLLDQIGVSFGGIVHIDFQDIVNPKVEKLTMNIPNHHFILVNTGGDHAHMSHLYSQIPLDMKEVAHILGVEFLRDTTYQKLEEYKDKIRPDLFLRAKHFFTENERVRKAIEAIKHQDVETFKQCMNESRHSSAKDLKNMMAEHYEGSPLEACDLVDKITNGTGACKINGGGFAGSIVTLIPEQYTTIFVETAKRKYGENAVYFVNIDNIGVGKY